MDSDCARFRTQLRGFAAVRAGLLAYGAALGTLTALQLIGGDRDVLTFPVIQRHRYFRLKHRLGPCEPLNLPSKY